MVNLCLILLYILSVGFRTIAYLQFPGYLKQFQDTRSTRFTLLEYPAGIYESALQADAVVIFFSVLHFFQYAVLSGHLKQILLVFKKAAIQISFYVGLFLLAFFGFIMIVHHVFGGYMAEFSTYVDTSTTLLQLIGGSPVARSSQDLQKHASH